MDFQSLSLAVGGIIALVLIRQVVTLFDNQNLNARLQKINQKLIDEIIERKRMESKLYYDAMHDAMTGLPNRTLFMNVLSRAMETTKRHTDYCYTVMFVDLDQFKNINDSLGHQVGDQLLKLVGERLGKELRSCDTIARFGGDEFGILVELADSDNSVQVVSQKVLASLIHPFEVESYNIHVTASIGIVMNTADYSSAEEILRDVDIAMYRAKELGRNRTEIFDISMRDRVYSRMEVENEVRCGLENHEFTLYFQPIMVLETNRLAGFEALIRWFHPKRGLIMPDLFLPIAETSGLILPISDWVLDEACRALKDWQNQFPSMQHLYVSVNIPNNYFTHPGLVEKVIQTLQKRGLKAESLKLEIAEGVLINNYSAASITFRELKKYGVLVQLDDFGTGYSALKYLQHFPLDVIKIDRSFINNLGKGENSPNLVKAMVTMARELGMEAIAEGIETDAQLEELKSISCTYGQGFLLSNPLDHASAQKLLARLEGHIS
jgi:diguanylate cyclase (GGDEF)-like protein